jgi:hypothetical protein
MAFAVPGPHNKGTLSKTTTVVKKVLAQKGLTVLEVPKAFLLYNIIFSSQISINVTS